MASAACCNDSAIFDSVFGTGLKHARTDVVHYVAIAAQELSVR